MAFRLRQVDVFAVAKGVIAERSVSVSKLLAPGTAAGVFGQVVVVDGPCVLVGFRPTVSVVRFDDADPIFDPTVDDFLCSVCIDRKVQLTWNRDFGVGGVVRDDNRMVTLGSLSTYRFGRTLLSRLGAGAHEIEVKLSSRFIVPGSGVGNLSPAVVTLEVLVGSESAL